MKIYDADFNWLNSLFFAILMHMKVFCKQNKSPGFWFYYEIFWVFDSNSSRVHRGTCGPNSFQVFKSYTEFGLLFSNLVESNAFIVPWRCCLKWQYFWSKVRITILGQVLLILVRPYSHSSTAHLRICTSLSWPRYWSFKWFIPIP